MKKFFVVLFSLIFLAGCGTEAPVEIAPEKVPPKAVKVLKIVPQKFAPVFEISGNLQPEVSATIAAEVSGRVEEILKTEGEKVTEGKSLLTFSADENQVRISLENAQKSFSNAARNLDLVKIAAEKNETAAKISLRQAEISLETAQKNHENTLNSNEQILLAAKTALQIAEKNSTDSDENLIKSGDDLAESARVAVDSARVVFFDALQGIDMNFCFSSSDKFQCTGGGLGMKDVTTLNRAKNLFRPADYYFAEFVKNFQSIEKSENLDQWITILDEAIGIGRRVREVLDATDAILRYSTTGANFTQSDLNSLETQNTSLKNLTEAQISSLNSMRQSIQDFKIQKPQTTEGLDLSVVQAGANLKQLEAETASAQNSSTANLEIAEESLTAAQNALASTQKSNELQIQSAKTQFDAAEKSLAAAQLSFEKLTIAAPFEGVVTDISVEKGETVSAGRAVAVVAQTENLKLVGEIAPEAAAQISLDSAVEVFNSAGEKLNSPAQISKIYPTADPLTRRVKIEVKIENFTGAVFANTFAKVKITAGKASKVIAIPPSALFEKNPAAIFVVNFSAGKNIVERREVILARRGDNLIEIADGLKNGEIILKERVISLENRDEIEILNSKEISAKELEEDLIEKKIEKDFK